MESIKKWLGISFGLLLILFISLVVITNSRYSFAIPTGINNTGKPTTTFTSNSTSTSVVNYIQTAAGSSSTLLSNFDVPVTLKTSDNSKPLYKFMKNLDTPMTSEQFELIDNNPTTITNKKILYILSHGYNSTNTNYDIFSTNTYGAVTDNTIKQYITQVALWLYIYENKDSFSDTYCANGACDFTSDGSTLVSKTQLRNTISTSASKSGYNYLNYITLLVDNATAYGSSSSSSLSDINGRNLSYTINDNYTLLTTDAITPSASGNTINYMYYSVEISDPNNYGVYITDNSGTKITSLNNLTGSFKVAVPLADDLTTMDLTSVKISVFGHFVYEEGYEYRVTASSNDLLKDDKTQRYSNVLLGYVPNEVVGINFNLHNFTKVSKIDITDSSELPGATLELTNTTTSEKQTWVSTDVPHYLELKSGNYRLCETIQPDGYELNTECIDFTVNDDKISVVTMENAPVTIPSTSKFKSRLITIIGIVLLVLGIAVTTTIVLNKKNNTLGN